MLRFLFNVLIVMGFISFGGSLATGFVGQDLTASSYFDLNTHTKVRNPDCP